MDNHKLRVIKDLEIYPQYKETLFNYGFILKKELVELSEQYPFYANWKTQTIGSYYLHYHFKQNVFIYSTDLFSMAMIGHAYNPFDMQIDENNLLHTLANTYAQSFDHFIDYLNKLTGIFTLFIMGGNRVRCFVDYAGFQQVYYGISASGNSVFYSHSMLAGQIEDYSIDEYVKRLKAYKFYPLYGEGLPYDITEYEGLHKVLPNTYVEFDGKIFKKERFHPRSALSLSNTNYAYATCVDRCAKILSHSMQLITKKFSDPAISLTGGTDSKTTLAATCGIYDRFKYFSYNSQPSEIVDCHAAKKICKALSEDGEQITHIQHDIPTSSGEYPEYQLVRSILFLNGNRAKVNKNDIMKRIYFFKNPTFKTEIKSWISEIGRAFFYKKYGLKSLPKKCKPKHLTSTSRVFFGRRGLYYHTNKINRQYIEDLGINDKIFNYDWSDIYFIEHRYGRWGSGVICNEQKFAYNITIPFNNRSLADLLLSVPLEKRIKDHTNFDIVRKLDRRISDINIHVVNYHHDKKRMLIDRAYFLINAALPF